MVRLFAFGGAAAVVALALSAPALALPVHVRVEGAGATIFGATEPRLAPVTGTIRPPAGDPVTVRAATPLGALERASRRGEFYYRLDAFSFGPYVAQVGRHAGGGTTGWVYKVNGVSPPVGAHQYRLRAGDRVLWYFARFGPAGGPKTLRLQRSTARIDCVVAPCPQAGVRTCFRAVAQDDNGVRTRVGNVVFRVNGGALSSASGELCRRSWQSVRVTKPGHVRSQLVVRARGGVRAATVGGVALAGRGS